MNSLLKSAVPLAIGFLIAVWATPQSTDSTGYPKKPVTLVVAYSPGGAVDNIARTIAQYIEPYLGQRIVVQNKPGAGGEIGYRSLARSANDGYTIGMITSPPILMLERLRQGSETNIADFEALVGLQRDPVVFAVNATSRYKTLDELVAAAKASPNSLNVAGDGPNSNNQLQLVVAEKWLGVDFNFIPFNGSAPSITALLGNQVDAAVPSASSVTTYVRRGDIRVLAVFSPDRYEYLPDAPTILEASAIAVPDIGAAVRGVVIPKGMMPERKQVLVNAFEKLVTDDEFIAHSGRVQLPLFFMSADEFRHYLANTDALLDEYVRLLTDEP